MLILSRKENQRIVFPRLGITIEVCRVDGRGVKLGIEAPPNVRVLREELAPRGESAPASGDVRRHELSNRMNTVGLALQLVRKRLSAGQVDEAQRPLKRALEELAQLEQVLAGGSTEPRVVPMSLARRALLVEDNPAERELLAEFLRVSGYDVDAVEDGEAALGYLKTSQRPDVVVLDMQMPRLDGRETVSAIRANPAFRGLKIVAVSGAEHLRSKMPLGKNGVDRWFSKPLRPADFVRELNTELGVGQQHACVTV